MERGSALVVTILTAAVALAVFSTFLRASIATKSLAAREYQGVQAYYVAESGLKKAIALPEVVRQLTTTPGGNHQGEITGAGSYTVTATRIEDQVFLFSSSGTAGPSQAVASMYVRVVMSQQTDYAVTAFGGAVSVVSRIHQQSNSWLRFQNMDMRTCEELGALPTSNYPDPKDYPIDVTDGLLWTKDLPGTFDNSWLRDKHRYDPNNPFVVDTADRIRDELLALKPSGQPDDQGVVEQGGTKELRLVAPFSSLAWLSRYDNNWTLVGGSTSGGPHVLEIVPRSQGQGYATIEIGTLRLTGDLMLCVTEGNVADIRIGSIEHGPSAGEEGYRLIVVGTRDVILSSGGAPPVFPDPRHPNREFFLGNRSVLWAARDINIRSDVWPKYQQALGTPSTLDVRDLSSIKAGYPSGPFSMEAMQANPERWGPIAFVAKRNVSMQLYVGRGLVYAGGGHVDCFFLRLHGALSMMTPVTQMHQGLANGWVSGDPQATIVTELLGVVRVQPILRGF